MLNLILIVNTMKILIVVNGKFKISDHVETSKYKSIFAKGMLQIGRKKLLLLAKLRIKFHGNMLLMI